MNYEIKINESQLPRDLEPMIQLVAISGDSELKFEMVCLFASHFVYDLDKKEYVDIEKGVVWVIDYIIQIGPEAFNKEVVNKLSTFLKKYGVYIIDGANMNPRNN